MPAETVPASVKDRNDQQLKAALARYRIIAYTVGVGLLLLCVATVLDWGFQMPQFAAVIAPIHGFLYMVYLALGVDLALKARWSLVGTGLVLISGTLPFLSFVAEHQVTKRVRAGRRL